MFVLCILGLQEIEIRRFNKYLNHFMLNIFKGAVTGKLIMNKAENMYQKFVKWPLL